MVGAVENSEDRRPRVADVRGLTRRRTSDRAEIGVDAPSGGGRRTCVAARALRLEERLDVTLVGNEHLGIARRFARGKGRSEQKGGDESGATEHWPIGCKGQPNALALQRAGASEAHDTQA